jgi:hypothetical protein
VKKFLFMYEGMWEFTDEMKAAWGDWFESVGGNMVDGGNPLGPGLRVTHHGTEELDGAPITGYSLFNASDLDAALELLEGCPIIDGVRVYEAMSM